MLLLLMLLKMFEFLPHDTENSNASYNNHDNNKGPPASNNSDNSSNGSSNT